MDLRKRTIHAFTGTGALLIVVGLSVGGGVAIAVPGPPAQPPSDAAKVTTAASDKKSSDSQRSDDKSSDNKSSDRKSKGRKSKSGSSGTDSTDRNNAADSSDSNRSNDSTATSATTTPTTTPPSTAPPTTRPTATTVPPTTATTAPPTTATTGPATTDTTAVEPTTGQYNGGEPYQATEAPTDESSSTTTAPPAGKAKAPASRSGSGLPPGIYPVDPGSNHTAGPASAPAEVPAPVSPTFPSGNTVVPAQSQPTVPPTSSVAVSGASEPATVTAPGAEVSGTETERGDAGAQHTRELVRTGDGTRRLILFGGVALLMGAVVVAFSGRQAPALAAAAIPVGPARRRPRSRQELDGWEDGIPLAPAKRELARSRLGISADSYYDDELGV